MVNVDVLRKELEFITAHKDQWNQAIWAAKTHCGTVACLAGWTVIHNTDEISWRYNEVEEFDAISLDVPGRAQEILNLNEHQAGYLFNPINTLFDLWNTASIITNGEIEVPVNITEEELL